MSLRRSVPVPVALCIGALALISACGSSSTTTASAGISASAAVAATAAPASAAAAPASSATAPASSDSGATAASTPDPCGLLTAAEVSAAVGGTVGDGVESAGTPPLIGKKCNWSNSGSTSPVIDFEITLRTDADLASTSQTVDDLFSESTSTFPGLTAAAGIGDKAFFGKTNGYVLKGGLLLDTVADIGGTADSSSINKMLTTMAVAKLP